MWNVVPSKDWNTLHRDLLPFGALSINPRSLIFQSSKKTSDEKNYQFWRVDQPSGWLAMKEKSVWLPILPQGLKDEDGYHFQKNLLPHSASVVALMGPTTWTKALENWLGTSQLLYRISYDLMDRQVKHPESPVHSLGDGFEIKEITQKLVPEIFPLQEAYEKEEVLMNPKDFRPLVSRLNLMNQVKTELVIALYFKGNPIAKLSSNAQTVDRIQVGGVFTKPEFRRKGFQKYLFESLFQRLSLENRGSCLFVKKENIKAGELYKSLGYTISGDFEISYWKR